MNSGYCAAVHIIIEVNAMINIPIDENTSILQPYYDGGESYKDNFKYSLIKKYKVNPAGSLSQSWCAFEVKVNAESKTVMEYECAGIDISGYNRFRIFGMIPESVRVQLYCNGVLSMDKNGTGEVGFADSDIEICEDNVKTLKYVFTNSGSSDTEITLFYLGMMNDNYTENKKSPYTSEWEGCFVENPNYDLYNEVAIDKGTISKLKEKIKKEPYKSIYEGIRKKADELMTIEPETLISKTVRRFHMAPRTKLMDAEALAICGQLEGNKEMLKMACRYALSLACCDNWCADVMETVQTITWHHRSFDEADAICTVCIIISLAGGLLSWHGLNLLYNAIIIKGLPRIEADLMTMDYIYKCNQGIVFLKGYIFAIAELMQRYPRYRHKFEYAKSILDEMYSNSFEKDGGYKEGAMYWRFIMMRYLNCLYLTAQTENKPLSELVGNKLDKTAEYGLANLDANAHILMFSDSARNVDYGMMIPAILYSITKKQQWASVSAKIKECWSPFDFLESASVDVPSVNSEFLKKFAYFESVGLTVCTRNGIQFGVTGGESNNTHCHADKGSFLINMNGREIIPDVACGYDKPEHSIITKTDSHSLAIPIVKGKLCEQKVGEGYAAPIEISECRDNVFRWKCNLTKIWNIPELMLAQREILSLKSNEFIITDKFEFEEKCSIQFNVNLAENAPAEIIPQNWTPKSKERRILLRDKGYCAYQEMLTSEESKNFELVTLIRIKND